jgi:putative methylase
VAIEVARRNAEKARVEVEWHLEDVHALRERFDSVLMNPPFGSQTRHADVPFFEVALAHGHVVYAFLNAKSETFVRRYVESNGGTVTDRIVYAFPIRHTFPFHREDLRRVDVVFYRIDTAKD